jgi:hypothetical protein
VDRRVQALLKRVHLPSGDVSKKIGCGTIERKGTQLTISFHKHAITLLSGNLTDTFAKFHEGLRRHQPSLVKNSKSDKEAHGLLSWMLGSRVIEDGRFDLITFMKRMEKETPVLPLKGFRRFLSYHKKVEEMDVLRYAMELYGYRTGSVADTKDVYGLILSPTTAVRHVDTKFSIYNNGNVTSSDWDPVWDSSVGFAVRIPSVTPASGSATASTSITASAASGAESSVSGVNTSSNEALAAALQEDENASGPVKNPKAVPFFSKKIEHKVTVGDTQEIGGKEYHLRGVIHHRGGDKGGHYIYFYRDPTNPTNLAKQWIRFDDEKPLQYEARPMEIDTGYVYLFERNGLNRKADPRGIINTENYCWMNAALQMFYHIPEYRIYIQNFDNTSSPLPKDIIDKTMIIKQIFELYANDSTLGHVVCTPQHEQLAKSLFQGNYNNQQDSTEFIRNVLLYIIAPLDNLQKRNGKDDDPVAAEVYSYFTIQEISRSVCVTNTSIPPSEGSSIATDITLSISQPSSLDTLLKNQSLPEKITDTKKLDGQDCDDIHRTITLTSLDSTKYVIIILKRFEKI